MQLSIIIPALNEADTIGRLLADLAPLRVGGAEVILVDGGSSDGTMDLAADAVDLGLSAARGRAAQMNAGASAATGDFFWFLHADTRVPQGAPEALSAAVASGVGWGRFDVSLSGRHPLLRLVERGMNMRSRMTGVATGDQGIFVKRALFEQIGGFPPLALMEDIAISSALRRRERPACLRCRLMTSSRRWEANGIARTILMMWRLRLLYALGTDPARLAHHYRRMRPALRAERRALAADVTIGCGR